MQTQFGCYSDPMFSANRAAIPKFSGEWAIAAPKTGPRHTDTRYPLAEKLEAQMKLLGVDGYVHVQNAVYEQSEGKILVYTNEPGSKNKDEFVSVRNDYFNKLEDDDRDTWRSRYLAEEGDSTSNGLEAASRQYKGIMNRVQKTVSFEAVEAWLNGFKKGLEQGPTV